MSSVRGSDGTSRYTQRTDSRNTGHSTQTSQRNSGVKINLNTKSRPYKELTVAGLICSVIGAVIIAILLDSLYMQLPNLILVPLSMMILTLPIVLVCGLIEARKMGLASDKFTLGTSRVIAFALAGTLAVGAVACVLEFIYELGFVYQGVNYDDYIFVIDDSGSMSTSDRSDKRYTALDTLIGNMDESNMIGVVRFSSDVDSELAPAVLNDSHRQRVSSFLDSPARGGGTDIQAGLERATELFAASRRSGRASAIILLSDGASASVDVTGLSEKLNKLDIDICTVALGSGADRNLLQDLADATGGIMLDVSDAEMLRVSYKLLNGGSLRRNLLMPRMGSDKGNILHIAMSILFMGALGSFISLLLVTMFHTERAKPQLVVGISASFTGAVIHELTNNMGLGNIGRFVMLVLFGLVLLTFYDYSYSQHITRSREASKQIRGNASDTNYSGRTTVNSDEAIHSRMPSGTGSGSSHRGG